MISDRSKTWNMLVERVRNKYNKRILKIMEDIKAELEAASFKVSDIDENNADNWSWNMIVYQHGDPNGAVDDRDVNIDFRINESTEFDGTKDGINFSLDVVETGGRVIGGLSPYNYTNKVWVNLRDKEAIEERFHIFEQADPHGVVELLWNVDD